MCKYHAIIKVLNLINKEVPGGLAGPLVLIYLMVDVDMSISKNVIK